MQDHFQRRGVSGATTERPALRHCLKNLSAVIVWKLDRLGRSLRDLITMLDGLKNRGVKFQSLTEAIDTETHTGRPMWQMIGVLAELERSLISERTRAGGQGGAQPGRKVRPQTETFAAPDRPRPGTDGSRAARGCSFAAKCGSHHFLRALTGSIANQNEQRFATYSTATWKD